MKDDKRLKRKVRNSYIVSTVSIMLVLFLLGSVGYLMVAAMKVAQTLQESIAVTVELQNGISDQQRETINKRLTAEELVATVAYVSKEDKADDAGFWAKIRCSKRSSGPSRPNRPTRSFSTASSPPSPESRASSGSAIPR